MGLRDWEIIAGIVRFLRFVRHCITLDLSAYLKGREWKNYYGIRRPSDKSGHVNITMPLFQGRHVIAEW